MNDRGELVKSIVGETKLLTGREEELLLLVESVVARTFEIEVVGEGSSGDGVVGFAGG